jgi:hypothetical protein
VQITQNAWVTVYVPFTYFAAYGSTVNGIAIGATGTYYIDTVEVTDSADDLAWRFIAGQSWGSGSMALPAYDTNAPAGADNGGAVKLTATAVNKNITLNLGGMKVSDVAAVKLRLYVPAALTDKLVMSGYLNSFGANALYLHAPRYGFTLKYDEWYDLVIPLSLLEARINSTGSIVDGAVYLFAIGLSGIDSIWIDSVTPVPLTALSGEDNTEFYSYAGQEWTGGVIPAAVYDTNAPEGAEGGGAVRLTATGTNQSRSLNLGQLKTSEVAAVKLRLYISEEVGVPLLSGYLNSFGSNAIDLAGMMTGLEVGAGEWFEVEIALSSLQVTANNTVNRLVIGLANAGSIWIDSVTLIPV